jgi:hypothetical protein
MAKSIRVSTKRRGRPATTGKGELIGVRILPPLLKELDTWIARQDPKPSRPGAIRRFLETSLAQSSDQRFGGGREAQKVSEPASRAAEEIMDKSMSVEEQQRRKRALIKGPIEFRKIREDPPRPKKS